MVLKITGIFLGAFARFFLKSGGFEPLGPKGIGIACIVFSHSCSLSVKRDRVGWGV